MEAVVGLYEVHDLALVGLGREVSGGNGVRQLVSSLARVLCKKQGGGKQGKGKTQTNELRCAKSKTAGRFRSTIKIVEVH